MPWSIDGGTSRVMLDQECSSYGNCLCFMNLAICLHDTMCLFMSLTTYLCTHHCQATFVCSSSPTSLLLHTSKEQRKCRDLSSNPGVRGKSALITNTSISSIQDFILDYFGSKAQNKDSCNRPFNASSAVRIFTHLG